MTISRSKLALSALGLVVVTAVIAGGTVFLTTGSSPSSEADDSSSSTSVATTATDPVGATNSVVTTTAEVDVVKVNEPITNGRVKATVKEVTSPATMSKYISSDTSGESGYQDLAPRSGARYILVKALIENVGTSGFNAKQNTVVSRLVDRSERDFGEVDSATSYEVNFARIVSDEIPDELQPGFSVEIYYIYEVPLNADVIGWAFYDSDETSPEYSYVAIEL